MVSFVIPNVFADTPSDSYDAVAINALSPVDPIIRTTFPFVIVCPVVFFTYINISDAFCDVPDVNAYDALVACEADIANEAVEAIEAVDANEAEVTVPAAP
jgi:hypothetical protein